MKISSKLVLAWLGALLSIAMLMLVVVLAGRFANDEEYTITVNIGNDLRRGSIAIYIDEMWITEYWSEPGTNFSCCIQTTHGPHYVRAVHSYGWYFNETVNATGTVSFYFE